MAAACRLTSSNRSTQIACKVSPSTVSTAKSQPPSTWILSAKRGLSFKPCCCNQLRMDSLDSAVAACCNASKEAWRPRKRCNWLLCSFSCAWIDCSCSRVCSASVTHCSCCKRLCAKVSCCASTASSNSLKSPLASSLKLSCSLPSDSIRSSKRTCTCSMCWMRDCWTSAFCCGTLARWLKVSHSPCQFCIRSSASSNTSVELTSSSFTSVSSGSISSSSACQASAFSLSVLRLDSASDNSWSVLCKSERNCRSRSCACWIACSTRLISAPAA